MTSSFNGSTKISTAPPQVRPISHASSSPSCRLIRRGADDESTSVDCSMTRASTHPPIVTEPKMFPSLPTNIFVPSLRGVVPAVRTSVAIVARLPAWRSRSIRSNVSCDMGLLEGSQTVSTAEVIAAAFSLRGEFRGCDLDGHVADRIDGFFDDRFLRRFSRPPLLHDLRNDAQRDLFRHLRADVEARGRFDSADIDAAIAKDLQDRAGPLRTGDERDDRRAGPRRLLRGFLVV